ncbi:MAG TPA: hypothetical protein VKA40_10420 [Nitrososphaera sp.]|nr:hypothetical protein [Nitrososphaera sp.]
MTTKKKKQQQKKQEQNIFNDTQLEELRLKCIEILHDKDATGREKINAAETIMKSYGYERQIKPFRAIKDNWLKTLGTATTTNTTTTLTT